ncbi:SWIM zinc finger family protein [Paenibacillus sp. FSL W8-0919]|uniref:SWIM zinc finger family protein n=1 Tax=Paenibacillus sp. FSL W8-0919 TaxID=2954707 RepID=UPI0030FA61B5
MNSYLTLDDMQWQELIQRTTQTFSDLTIKRGFQYFKQGRVRSSELSDPSSGVIDALVQGSVAEPYQVRLRVNSLSDSECSCPVEGACKHMAAVLLDYAQQQGRSIHALVNAHSMSWASSPITPNSLRPRTAAGQAAPSPQKWRDKAEQLPTLPITAWHELFDICTASLGTNTQNSFYAKNALAALHYIKPPLPADLEPLYGLHAHLFVLEKLVKQQASAWNSSGSYIGYHTQVAADHVQDQIGRILKDGLEDIEPGEAFRERLDETKAYIRRSMLVEPRNRKFFAKVYMQLWIYWISPVYGENQQTYADELKELQAAEGDFGASLSRAAWLTSQSLMHFYMRQDEAAWELLREADKLSTLSAEFVLGFFHMLYSASEWERLARWLPEIGPLLGSHRNEHLSRYQDYWDAVIEHVPEAAERMWNCLASLLPYSKHIYQNALMTHGRWREWIDYQLSTGREPLELRVSDLAPVEKHAPELLLPFYHQAVERYILHKNRDGYKAAVKLLKRLAKLYKKLKQQERWDLFITSLSVRNSRLRAFQEELRRGKLIS